VEELYAKYVPLIKRYAYLYRNVEDSESEAWLLFAEAIKSYDSTTGVPFEGYVLSKIKWGMYNLTKKKIKNDKRITLYDPNIDTLEEDMKIDYDPYLENPEVKLIKKEDAELVNKTIDRLTHKQGKAILQTIVNDDKLINVADGMGITAQGVFNLKLRGLTKMRKSLLGNGYEREG